jgi:2-hydroxychromene-2-carboxylate isomerase
VSAVAGGQPRPTRRSLVAAQIARHRDPRSVLLARGRRLGVGGPPPPLELYYEPGDPHSHLCAQLLPELQRRLDVGVEVRLVGESAAGDYPERERQRAYAILDATRVAPALGLSFPAAARVPDAAGRAAAAIELAAIGDASAFAVRAGELAVELFAGRPVSGGSHPRVEQLLAANAARRARLGHYLPAVWHFDGDLFWGVDRLHHLEARLRRRRVLRGDGRLSILHAEAAELPRIDGELPELEFFYSFRSPYSFLALLKMREFHARWPGGVRVRPVLPMAMRSIAVPRAKRMYTLRDVKREAALQGVAFGRVADPLGDGARRLLQVFQLAATTEQQLDYLVSAGRAVWAEGIDVAGDDGLAFVCERAEISWSDARALIAGAGPIEYAEQNRLELLGAGLWGVPCYRVGEHFAAWGQDRFWMLPELLARAGSRARAGLH